MVRKKQASQTLSNRGVETAPSAVRTTGRASRAASLSAMGYSQEDTGAAPEGSVEAALGCGNPTALARLRPGQCVLDLGSGGGLDAFIAARKVATAGRVIGIDAASAMVERAAAFAVSGGYGNVEFRVGQFDRLPLDDNSIDVIISNCAINHALDKAAVFREARRVLKPAGEICIVDLVVEGRIAPSDDPGMRIWREWLAVACGKREYLRAIRLAGFRDLATDESAYAGKAMIPALEGKIIRLGIRARK